MNRSERAKPKPIVAQDQVRLGLGRCLQLAVSGMSYRLFRSLVTTATLALASAFLVHMLGFGLLEQETFSKAYQQTKTSRKTGQQLSRFSQVDTDKAILTALQTKDSTFCTEARRFSAAGPADFDAALATAHRLAVASKYFDELPTAPKAVIVGDRNSEELFVHLANAPDFDNMAEHVKQFSLRAPLDDLSRFRTLVMQERPALMNLVAQIRVGHARAIEQLGAELRRGLGKTLDEALLTESADRLVGPMQQVGFTVTEPRIAELAQAARRAHDQKGLEHWLNHPSVASAIARRYDIEINSVNFDKLATNATSVKDAVWFLSLTQEAGATEFLPAEKIAQILKQYRHERKLVKLAGDKTPDDEQAWFGLSPRNQWLVILSFLVCMVGVANAMLMSVTERFTEIATMKCLGAMDRFVMQMFVLEALIQGAVGGLVGLVLGLLLSVLRAFVEFGTLANLATGAAGAVGLAMLVALLCTMLLAALSAVGPSYVAARLSPMEAMRVE